MHTPGPWTTEEMQELLASGERRPSTYISASNGWASPKRTVAIVGHWRDRPDPEADARLIAAAPELLEALETIMDSVDAKKVRLDVYELELAKRAIDKAIGK